MSSGVRVMKLELLELPWPTKLLHTKADKNTFWNIYNTFTILTVLMILFAIFIILKIVTILSVYLWYFLSFFGMLFKYL